MLAHSELMIRSGRFAEARELAVKTAQRVSSADGEGPGARLSGSGPTVSLTLPTGDTMLGLHEHVYGRGPCMRCFFPETRSGPSAAQRLSKITGLPVALLASGDEILRDEHLVDLTSDERAKLVQHLGNPVCGLARTFGLTDLDAGDYQPSASFISLQAASLAIGRVLAYKLDIDGQPNFVQYDGLYGPQTAALDTMQPVADCYCQTHSPTIKKVRLLRSGYCPAGSGTRSPTGSTANSI